jgi:chemotaxis protein MotA
MDISVPLGMIAGIVLIIFSIIWAGGSLLLFVDVPSALCTFGGCIASMLVAFKIPKLMLFPTLIKICIFPPKYNPMDLILTIVSLSEKARREGLLSLEDVLQELNDPFMKKALQLIVDGTDPVIVKVIMESDIEQMAARHDDNKRMMDEAAAYAPGFGMIGTLMGLVMMLVNLNDRASVGPYLAVAIITTFYGAVLAYLIFTPIGIKLDMLTSTEVNIRTIILEGALSIQSGDNPRIVKDKLVSYLPPDMREKVSMEVGD